MVICSTYLWSNKEGLKVKEYVQAKEGLVWSWTSPKAWYGRIDDYLKTFGIVKSPIEGTL